MFKRYLVNIWYFQKILMANSCLPAKIQASIFKRKENNSELKSVVTNSKKGHRRSPERGKEILYVSK